MAVNECLYVYCVVPASAPTTPPGTEGVEGKQVYALSEGDVAALVHDCQSGPYSSDDQHQAEAWVLAHHGVAEAAWERAGTVLPLTFNTIVKPENGKTAVENLRAWLRDELPSLKAKLDTFSGRAEYGVQLFWDPGIIGKQVIAASQEMAEIEAKVGAASRGLAYMQRQRLERLLKAELEARAKVEVSALLASLQQCAGALRVGRTKAAEGGQQMLANVSCLLPPEEIPRLQAQLQQIRERAGLTVRVVGPFPPYSFC
jgi:hypothetical protein